MRLSIQIFSWFKVNFNKQAFQIETIKYKTVLIVMKKSNENNFDKGETHYTDEREAEDW